MKLYYQLPGTWFGDCMPFGKGDEFFLFHQRDNRNPTVMGEPFGWSLSTTKDFVHYKDCGIAVPRGGDDEQDQFIYAGSVCEAEGQYHAFYTGYNRDYAKQGKASQVIMHAVSGDLYHWQKTPENLHLEPRPGYDNDDWRDPFVTWDEDNDQYVLILGSRKAGPKTCQTGRTVKFVSKDLKHWDFAGDFWAPDLFTMHEMVDLFKMGDWWYHIVTEYSDKHGMTYRMAKSLDGPWIDPEDDAFDGSGYYAARSFALNGKRVLFGWVATKENDDDTKNYEWAGAFMPHELYQRADGTLGVKPVDTLWNAFDNPETIEDTAIEGNGVRKETVLARDCGDLFSFEADVSFDGPLKEFGLQLLYNEDDGQSYQFRFPVAQNHYIFEKAPNWPLFADMNIGQERPISLEAGHDYHIQLVIDDTIATLYANGVALNARMYTRPGSDLAMSATNGRISVRNAVIRRGLK